MYFLPEPVSVEFADDALSVGLEDGRTITVPIAWYPRLLKASPEQRLAYELSPAGIHWDEIDEDISVEGMLIGRGEAHKAPRKAA
jgi:Protein of unknown function (DUF2442)